MNEKKQRGAVAIEFAAIFIAFFTLVYGIFAFGFPAAARLAFQHYSAEAARASLSESPNSEEFESDLSSKINNIIIRSWVPEDWRNGCTFLANEGWIKLPKTEYGYWRLEPNPGPGTSPRHQVNVCIQTNEPIIPPWPIGSLSFPPPYTDNTGRSWVRGYTITTL